MVTSLPVPVTVRSSPRPGRQRPLELNAVSRAGNGAKNEREIGGYLDRGAKHGFGRYLHKILVIR